MNVLWGFFKCFLVQRPPNLQLFVFTSVRSGFKTSSSQQLWHVRLSLTSITKSSGSHCLEVYNHLHTLKEGHGL